MILDNQLAGGIIQKRPGPGDGDPGGGPSPPKNGGLIRTKSHTHNFFLNFGDKPFFAPILLVTRRSKCILVRCATGLLHITQVEKLKKNYNRKLH